MNKKPNMSVSQKIAEISAAKKKKKKTSFLKEMKEEMKRVSWTTQDELKTCGKIVVGAIFFLGLGIYVVDLVIRIVLGGIGNIVRLIGA